MSGGETRTGNAFVSVTRDGPVVTATIERPEVRNALHRPAHRELAAVLDDYAADGCARVLVITGTGERAFCAGSDLELEAETSDDHPPGGFGGITERFDLDKPVVAAVNADAMGGASRSCLPATSRSRPRTPASGFPSPGSGWRRRAGCNGSPGCCQ